MGYSRLAIDTIHDGISDGLSAYMVHRMHIHALCLLCEFGRGYSCTCGMMYPPATFVVELCGAFLLPFLGSSFVLCGIRRNR